MFQSNKRLGGNHVKLNVRYFNDKHGKEEVYSRHYNFTSTQSVLNMIKQKFDKIDRMEAVFQRLSQDKKIEIVDDEDLLVSILRFQSSTREEESKHGLDILTKNSITSYSTSDN
ncbi:hypothetical protein EDC94DRAFT_589994 [Helicostylum pulchrum]|nr:hypothetical protein EDC94DRAFT_589994 [Helicostylum pulchrum]